MELKSTKRIYKKLQANETKVLYGDLSEALNTPDLLLSYLHKFKINVGFVAFCFPTVIRRQCNKIDNQCISGSENGVANDISVRPSRLHPS